MKIYFIGICGIGMSGIAQALHSLGNDIAGSDREISENGVNASLVSYMKKIGIRIFPQDGSFIKEFSPDLIVYSTAIEKDNPDFNAAGRIRVIHRSEALKIIMESVPDKISIAVTGTNGKTSVSAWLADAIFELKLDPLAIIGGKVAKFAKANGFPGNFKDGKGKFIVFEADESDKSILNYSPDYAVILNTGPDHYPIEEQNIVFAKFANLAKKGIICSSELLGIILPNANVPVFSFGEKSERKKHFELLSYKRPNLADKKAKIKISTGSSQIELSLPSPGHHNALNACAVLATLHASGLEDLNLINAIEKFAGVERRFKICGKTKLGAMVIDDYAHNPDKIASCIKTAKELSIGKLFFVFQPHGYAPLGFMQEKLGDVIKENIYQNDLFIFLPVFYAGGTSSFKPSSEEVIANFAKQGIKNCEFRKNRADVESLLASAQEGDIIVIAGARDDSLSTWAKSLATQPAS